MSLIGKIIEIIFLRTLIKDITLWGHISAHTTAMLWKLPRCPSRTKGQSKRGHMHTVEYYAATKKEKFLSAVRT